MKLFDGRKSPLKILGKGKLDPSSEPNNVAIRNLAFKDFGCQILTLLTRILFEWLDSAPCLSVAIFSYSHMAIKEIKDLEIGRKVAIS